MVTKATARMALRERLAKNLVILDEFENHKQWCFGLGFVNEKDENVESVKKRKR